MAKKKKSKGPWAMDVTYTNTKESSKEVKKYERQLKKERAEAEKWKKKWLDIAKKREKQLDKIIMSLEKILRKK